MLAGYLRVSHVGGRANLRSPEEQAQEIEAWAAAHGFEVEILPPELDAKGSDASRPIFRQAVEGVKAGRYQGVVVAYLSRAGRDLRLMLNLWDEIETAGGVVFSARENIDGSTPTGRMQRNFLATIAQHELEERRDGFERATKNAVERGIWQRRQTPRGYSKDPATRRLVPNDQAREVKKAARDFLGGKGVMALARDLGMTAGGVRALLRNRVYLGELKVRSYTKTDAHPAILDLETFDAVQEKLGVQVRPARSGRPISLLAGVVRCQSCGHVMTRTGSEELVYVCPTNHSGERCPRPAAIGCRRIDPYVEEIAKAELDRLEAERASGGEAVVLRERVNEAKAERARFLEAVELAGISVADAAAAMKRRNDAVEIAEADLRRELARLPDLPEIEGGGAIWDRLNHVRRNTLLRSLLAAVIVKPAGKGKVVPVADRVRVLKFGADLDLPAGRTGSASGIVPLRWPDADGVDVLRVFGVE